MIFGYAMIGTSSPFTLFFLKRMLPFLLTCLITCSFLPASLASDDQLQDETTPFSELAFSGTGSHTTKVFTVEDGWKISWETESSTFKLTAHGIAQRPYTGSTNQRDRILQWLETVQPIILANTTEPKGHAFHPSGGRFYLKIIAKGSWVLRLMTVKDDKDYLDVPYTAAP